MPPCAKHLATVVYGREIQAADFRKPLEKMYYFGLHAIRCIGKIYIGRVDERAKRLVATSLDRRKILKIMR